jgi:hypothetical protein
VVPQGECERYMPFARELYATLRHEPQASSRRLQGRLGTRSEIAKPISVMSRASALTCLCGHQPPVCSFSSFFRGVIGPQAAW